MLDDYFPHFYNGAVIALSYLSGALNDLEPIIVDGLEVKVKRNLTDALRTLHQASSTCLSLCGPMHCFYILIDRESNSAET